MKKVFFQSFEAIKKNKKIVYFNFFVVLISLLIGLLLSKIDNQLIIDAKQRLLDEISQYKPIVDIISAIKKNNIFYSIFYTFFYNLFFGAFISTTLTGLIFPLPVIISFQRGIMIGLLFGFQEGSIFYYLIFLGTLILEFAAYILSATAGVSVGLSFVKPQKYNTKNRFIAFKKSLLDAVKIYYMVIFLLFLAACWEIIGLYLLK